MNTSKISAALLRVREIDQKYKTRKFEDSSSSESLYHHVNPDKKPVENTGNETKVNIKIPLAVQEDSLSDTSESENVRDELETQKSSTDKNIKIEETDDKKISEKNEAEAIVEEELVESSTIAESISELSKNEYSDSTVIEDGEEIEEENEEEEQEIKDDIEQNEDYDEDFETDSSETLKDNDRSQILTSKRSSTDSKSGLLVEEDTKSKESNEDVRSKSSNEISIKFSDKSIKKEVEDIEDESILETNKSLEETLKSQDSKVILSFEDVQESSECNKNNKEKEDDFSIIVDEQQTSKEIASLDSVKNSENDSTSSPIQLIDKSLESENEENSSKKANLLAEKVDEKSTISSLQSEKEASCLIDKKDQIKTSASATFDHKDSNIDRRNGIKMEKRVTKDKRKTSNEQSKGKSKASRQMRKSDDWFNNRRKLDKRHICQMILTQETEELRNALKYTKNKQRLGQLEFPYFSSFILSDETKTTFGTSDNSVEHFRCLQHSLLDIKQWLKIQLQVYHKHCRWANEINSQYVPTTLADTRKMIREIRKQMQDF